MTSLEVKLTPRPVYPVKLSIVAEGLHLVSLLHLPDLPESGVAGDHALSAQGSKGYATHCQLHLQHDEVRQVFFRWQAPSLLS